MGAMSMSTKIRKDEFIQSSETGVGKLRPADLILYFKVSTFGQKMYFASFQVLMLKSMTYKVFNMARGQK